MPACRTTNSPGVEPDLPPGDERLPFAVGDVDHLFCVVEMYPGVLPRLDDVPPPPELPRSSSKITVPKRVTLPAGPAELIAGTIPAGGGLSNGIELYLIPHGRRVYELSFQIDSEST